MNLFTDENPFIKRMPRLLKAYITVGNVSIFYFFRINNVEISFKQLTATLEDTVYVLYMNIMFSVAANRNSVLVSNIYTRKPRHVMLLSLISIVLQYLQYI
jgi:hypothetical protein